MKHFNAAIIGCGGVSAMHFEGYLAHPDRVHIAAACDREIQRAEASKHQYGLPAAFGDLDTMIADCDWDIGIVCTPTPVREGIVRKLAAAGKHVFCEKPLADTYAEAARMVRACKQAGVKIAVNQNFRYHYPCHILRSLLSDRRLGAIYGITHCDLGFRADTGWRTNMQRHALAVMGVHWLDGFRWALRREATSIICRTHSSPAIDCRGETDAHIQIRFGDDTTVSYTQSFSSPLRRVETIAVCEHGSLAMNYDTAAFFEGDSGDEPDQMWHNPWAGANKPESAFAALEELLGAIEADTEPDNSGSDNLKTISLLEGAYRSAESRRPVSFESGLLPHQ